MIIAKHTPKNVKLIEKIADIEIDLQMFGNHMTDEEFDSQMNKLAQLYGKIEK